MRGPKGQLVAEPIRASMPLLSGDFRCVHDAELGDEIGWLEAPDYPNAESVAAAIALEYDEVAESATLRSPIFVGVDRGVLIGASLIFDARMGFVLGVDLCGESVGLYNRVVDPLYASTRASFRGRNLEAGDGPGESETVLAPISRSLLMRYRDVGLTLRAEGRGANILLGLPAHLLEGFLRRIESHLPLQAGAEKVRD